jgi:hypothetical protein
MEVGAYTLDGIESHKSQTHLNLKFSSLIPYPNLKNLKPKLKCVSHGYIEWKWGHGLKWEFKQKSQFKFITSIKVGSSSVA